MGYKINYTGIDNSDALEHWKYLRRERVGDKWRYYYEKDDAKLHVSRAEKSLMELSTSISAPGLKKSIKLDNTSYYVKSPETGGKRKKVSKETYDKTKTGNRLYIGDKLASEVAKEQLSVGMQFVKDLFSKKVTTEKSTVRKGKDKVSSMLRRLADKVSK